MSAGTILVLVGPEYEEREYRGKHGYPCAVDGRVTDFPAAGLAGLVAPGGWAPDRLRRDHDVLARVREVHAAGKMVATICHGPWVLISAGIVKGRRMTSTVGIPDDLVNAGANWADAPTVMDGNLVSARVPKDLPAFGPAMLEVLERRAGAAAEGG